MSNPEEGKTDRRYICTACESIVRARWSETTTFFIGCDCTSVPVVPQMTQHDTPDKWHVVRPECCRGVEAKTLDTCYGERGRDYKCPDCGAEYNWKGTMVGAPGPDESEPRPEAGLL
jgi:hypothetical protein